MCTHMQKMTYTIFRYCSPCQSLVEWKCQSNPACTKGSSLQTVWLLSLWVEHHTEEELLSGESAQMLELSPCNILRWRVRYSGSLSLDHSKLSRSSTLTYLSIQPLLVVNLSPVFVNLYFPYAGWGLLSSVCEPVFPLCRPGSFFFRWWQQHFEFQQHVWQWKEEAMLC